ncbi:MAG: transketolase [Clostridiales Family XIII bacterium]|jgi:transketolase|nr:transketolase [Clostridiales Family XIII bacterium]
MKHTEIRRLEEAARNARINVLKLANAAGANGAHIASSLSPVDIYTALFQKVMRFTTGNPHDPDRDRFVLSKGHGALGYYAAMYEAGMISKEELLSFEVNGGGFPGQPSRNIDYAIEYSGGSLGLGLSFCNGLALSKDCKGRGYRIYALLGDGEQDEGIVWESAMFAGYHKLSAVTAVIDNNHMQLDGFTKDILSFDAAGMWAACGWEVIECDGHDPQSLCDAFGGRGSDRPCAIIAHTTKGKGVSFIENAREWHHGRLSDKQLAEALAEMGAGGADDGC